ncbi:hypothetical protein SASPL_114006 [Salvia splendens]|uniref:THH1/TOM1/TOM3 domain-containing protein n=1 Tax=Salvia splendens TaxID=180675 RepID=A0A8X8Y4R7_SALSN|nr:hypothetical protein SASPL_114006 [Salvia splendens]
MVVASVLIWIGMGKNPIDSAVVAQARILASLLSSALASLNPKNYSQIRSNYLLLESHLVYVDLMAIAVLLLGGALACYGEYLFPSYNAYDAHVSSALSLGVAGLAIVSVICFTSSAAVAMATNIPLVYHWHEQQIGDIYTSLLLVLYYFIGSSVPSAFVLFVMRELPPLALINSRRESTTIAFISDRSVAVHPQCRTNETNARSQSPKFTKFLAPPLPSAGLRFRDCRFLERARYERLHCAPSPSMSCLNSPQLRNCEKTVL